MRASLAVSLAAAYGLAASVATASSLAAVHVSCRKMSPFGRSHSSRNLAMAAWPSGASLAGPATSIRDVRDTRRQLRRHRKLDGHGLRRAVDRDLDVRGKIALRRRRFLRLRHRVARQAIEQVLRHLRVVLPADEIDRACERGRDRRRRDDFDAIANRVVGMAQGRGAGRRRWGRLGVSAGW